MMIIAKLQSFQKLRRDWIQNNGFNKVDVRCFDMIGYDWI